MTQIDRQTASFSEPKHFGLHIMRSLEAEWGHHAHELTDHLLEPPLAVLTLVSDPSAVTDARPIDALPRQAVLVARFGRRGVSGQHQVKQHTDHQVSADAAQATGGGRFGSQGKRFVVTFDRGIHSYFPGAEYRTGPFGICGRGKPRLLRTMLL